MNTVIVENCKTLFIGRRGENEVTEVVFDFSEWQEQFGTGVIDLYVKRNLDVDAYPVVLSVDGTVATWLVTAADTDVVGNGKIEFVYTVNEKVAKSAVFPFFVGEDIGESSPEPPEHYQSWLEQLTELGAETQANAQAAAQSASEAAESAAQVAEDSNNAEAWAVGERNGEPVSEDDPTYNNNAKYWAENARANAPVQSVNGEDGDVVLTLDDIPNGETYVRATTEQLAQITTNAENIASVEAIASTALQPDDLTPYRTAAQQSSIDNDLNSKINRNTGSIADINARIPFSASASNKLVDQNSFDSKLSDYRTASQQNLIDNNKQTKITANGILKGNGLGGISAAVAGMDYLPTSALAAYRSANAQDAIDNAQNQNINKNTAAINTMQPAATAADIGKALIVKTVADGKPTSYEYGEAGGGGSTLTAGDGIDISNDVISNTQGIEYIVGTQNAATAKWTGVSTDETLKVGKIIAYYLPFAGTSTAATLALTMADGTTTREISLQLKPNATVTTQFPAGSIIILVYDGTYWRVNASYDTDTNTNPTGYCLTNGSVAAKAAACSFGYRGDTNYFPCLFRYANTATDATLAITTYAPEAAPIYVNGARTSATNTFGAGVILFLYYNGAYYCYNDGRFPILVDGAVTSVQEYATGLLVNYRTSAAQDVIDAGKQAKITASGILKGDGAGGVSSAVAGTDYATPQQVSEKYTKPSSGIPSTDMTAAVQASLIKADTALQAVPDTYRTAADQDLIDNGKQAKITASGILKGDGAGGVSAAVAGVDYLKSAPVTSVNGQTGDVTIQTATDAQVTTAVNTWLGENVAQETGYVLDASLTMSNAAPPASAVGDLKSAFITDTEAITGNTPLTFIPGRYIASSGNMAAGLQVSFAENSTTPFMCAISPCQPGDKFTAHIYGYSGTNRAYFFCDANMRTVAGGWAVANYELNGTKTAPAGAAFVVFNNRMQSLPNGYYAVKGVALKKVVDDMVLEPNGSDQTQDITSKLTADGFCQLGSGDFYVSNVIMPSGSKLCGYGEATRLHFATGSSGNMVTMGDCCTVCDISLYGTDYVDGSGNPISIESAKNSVTVDSDVIGVPTENETATNLWTQGNISVSAADKYVTVNLASPLPAGIYRLGVDVVRTDNSTRQSLIRLKNSDGDTIAQMYINKNDRSIRFPVINEQATAITFVTTSNADAYSSEWENIRITNIPNDKTGVCWTGDSIHFGQISNCRFYYFNQCGIYMLDTGTPVDRNLYVSDCVFFKNNVGIYIRKNSEYNKFVNCVFNYNYYGVLNRGGNNYFTNCGFDKNYVGYQVDSFEGSNGGHGGVSNCSINHSEPNNTGYGVIVDHEEEMLFSNCVVGYSKILLNSASGCVFSSCFFGDNIIIRKGNSNMVIGCYFHGSDSTITAIDNAKTKVINCYYFVSGNAVPLVTETT